MNPLSLSTIARNQTEAQFPNLRDGLIGAWVPAVGVQGARLFDISGRNNHGTILGPTWGAGRAGKTLAFTGSSGYVDLGSNPVFGQSASMSVVLFLTPGTIQQYDVAISKVNFDGAGWRLWTRDTSSFKWYWEVAAAQYITSASAIGTMPQVVVATAGPAGRTLWVNGKLEGSGAAYAIAYYNMPLLLGTMYPSNNYRFMGMGLHAAYIYSRDLTAGEIQKVSADPFAPLRRRDVRTMLHVAAEPSAFNPAWAANCNRLVA